MLFVIIFLWAYTEFPEYSRFFQVCGHPVWVICVQRFSSRRSGERKPRENWLIQVILENGHQNGVGGGGTQCTRSNV